MPNIIGFISIASLASFVFYLAKITPEFSFSKHVISQLGVFPKSKYPYLASLLIYCPFRFIFFYALFTRFSLWQNYPIIVSFVVAYLSFIITAFVSLAAHTKIHSIAATISALFTALLIFFLGLQLLQLSFIVGVTNILIANLMLWGSWLVKHTKGLNSYFQIFYISNLIIWDSLMLFFLFGLPK